MFHSRVDLGRVGMVAVAVLVAAVGLLGALAGSAAAASTSGTRSQGYWEVTSAGDIYSFGDAPFYGSAGNLSLAQPIVSMAVVPGGGGYWLVARDGGVFSYGDAGFYGSVPGLPAASQPTAPVVGLVPSADGHGYWEVTSAGDIYSFGDAPFYGSAGNLSLSKPIVGMAVTPGGGGYWLVASDGGVFSYGDATYYGSVPGLPTSQRPNTPVVGFVPANTTSTPTPTPPSLTITTSSLPSATADSSYTATIQAAGGTPPYSWAITSGSLPAGLSLSSGGTISGTPSAQGTASFTVQVTDSSTPDPQVASTTLSVAVSASAAPALTITTSSLPSATADSSYTTTLQVAGGTPPYSWAITSGSLPAGLSLSSGGTISGTPSAQGTASFTVQVTDSSTPNPQTANATFSISVAEAPITTTPNWSGYVVPSSANLVTEVSGEWTVPTLNCAATPNGTVTIWVGIGGFGYSSGGSSGVLLQTGVAPTCVNGAQQNVGWWEEYPSNPNYSANFANFPVSAGDVIEASVYEGSNGAWETRVNDLSTGLSGIMVTGDGWGVYSDGSGSSFAEQGSTAGLSYSGGYTAEWIVEDPEAAATATLEPFADYGTVTFSDLTTSLSSWSLTSSEAVEMVQGNTVLSTPSPPSTDGFSVSYTG